MKDISLLEETLGHKFKDRDVLIEALTHRSFHHESPHPAGYNERLEFLGDSVLGLIVVEYLYGREGYLKESLMSKIKSFVVKGSVLSEMARGFSLGDFMRLGKGEEETGGRDKGSVLSDAMEAVIGALYLDAGYRHTRDFVIGSLKERLDGAVHSGKFYDYKTELQEESQMKFGSLPEYRVVKEEGEEHEKVFTVEVYLSGKKRGTGRGKSKKEAQAEAAKEALGWIKI